MMPFYTGGAKCHTMSNVDARNFLADDFLQRGGAGVAALVASLKKMIVYRYFWVLYHIRTYAEYGTLSLFNFTSQNGETPSE